MIISTQVAIAAIKYLKITDGFNWASTVPLKPEQATTTRNNCTIWKSELPFISTSMAAMPPKQLKPNMLKVLLPIKPLL